MRSQLYLLFILAFAESLQHLYFVYFTVYRSIFPLIAISYLYFICYYLFPIP